MICDPYLRACPKESGLVETFWLFFFVSFFCFANNLEIFWDFSKERQILYL